MSVVGHQGLDRGITLVGSHTDVPRLDLKPHPLYEEEKLAFLKTHYYGGIKKYQWLAVPLALHGVVCLIDGRVVEINVATGRGTRSLPFLIYFPIWLKNKWKRN
ncbi:hypothetical protein N752_24300 [Desulforamulus aquiferis]|nr:hypothetical protein [Desulforamulus aquiferis]RYD02455.1 hypothetical protein N752_24300 [Desulforamulus aquiferis]